MFDPNDGTGTGATFIPTDLNPENQSRADARRSYYDPYISRPNFHVVVGNLVTRILFDSVNGTEGSSAGSSSNGAGSSSFSGGLFGNGSTVPPTGKTRHKSLKRSTSGLRAIGIEVKSYESF
jgi:hypothetical protein